MSVAGPGEPAEVAPAAAQPPTVAAYPVDASAFAAKPDFPAPAGPGVIPPFPAPPTEGRTARLWWGIGVGAAAVLLCCGGGTVAMTSLGLLADRAFNEQVDTVVGGYFDAVRDEDYDEAYRLLCDAEQDRRTPAEFADDLAGEDGIKSYKVGRIDIAGTKPSVAVDVAYDSGRTGTVRVRLDQDSKTGGFEVCGVEG